MNILICTIKSWNIAKANDFIKKYSSDHNVMLITEKDDLSETFLSKHSPDYIFFPHWSYIIPSEIYEKYNCVVFHMTDLPFGRGGSPLQNLISRGIYQTKISAIKVSKGLDTGPVYLKRDLDISFGSATDIFTRASDIIFSDMIPYIIQNAPEPVPQEGEPTIFKRRTPSESELQSDFSKIKIYDYIRMLDGEGYPNAFIRFGNTKLVFRDAKINTDNNVTAVVEFIENGED